MFTYFKILLSAFLVTALSTAVMADYRDYNNKTWNFGWKKGGATSTATARYNRAPAPVVVHRAPAPVIVKSAPVPAPAPQAIAKKPTTERSFSYDPSEESVTPNAAVIHRAPYVGRAKQSNRAGDFGKPNPYRW